MNIRKRLSIRELKKQFINLLLINERIKEIEDLRYAVSKLEFQLGGHLNGKQYWLKNEVGFNGQIKRKETFGMLTSLYSFDCFLETGTNIGATTGHIAALTNKPVYSCEIRLENFSIAKQLLEPYFESITLYHLNSIDFLKLTLPVVREKAPFFYLDAHWYDFLPLRQEIEMIASQCKNFAILIDDFEVIGDRGYGYDKYAGNKELTLRYIKDLVAKFDLAAYFPLANAHEESGARRGYIYLAGGTDVKQRISEVPTLKRHVV